MNSERIGQDVVVSIQYRLSLEDGTLVEESAPGDPLVYLHGYDNIIPGLEQALAGMAVGESKLVTVEPADGYGDYDPDDVEEISRAEMPTGVEPQIGMMLEVHDDEGEDYVAVVKQVGDDKVLLDFNHPLAGQRLRFDVTIEGLRAATSEEIAHGHAHSDNHHHH